MKTIDMRKSQNRLVVVLFLCLQLKFGRSKILEERDVVCTSDQMVVNLSFMEPFDGTVYAQNHYQDHLEYSITLVIMPETKVLTADSFGLTVRCIIDQKDIMLTLAAQSMDSIHVMHTETMTVQGNSGSSPQLLMQILDGHGLTGENITEAFIGQRLTLDTMLQDTSVKPPMERLILKLVWPSLTQMGEECLFSITILVVQFEWLAR